MTQPLLTVDNLKTHLWTEAGPVHAVDGISFEVRRGETFALVGESGCGKSVTALSIMRLLPEAGRVVEGNVRLGDTDLLALPEAAMRDVRGRKVAMIFQEPQTSLNPVMTVGQQIGEVLARHKGQSGEAARKRTVELLEAVGIPDPARRVDDYPFQLSGGMKQRVMIAMALAGEPDLLIADEPTTALDVTIQAQVLELMRDIQRRTGMAILLITHDLGVVAENAHRVAVMYGGKILESGDAADFFAAPRHPYSRQLFDALPSAAKRGQKLGAKEEVPVPPAPPSHEGEEKELLEVDQLQVWFPIRKGLLKRTVGRVKAVDGVSLSLKSGRTLALVGESGCGKTTAGKAILRLIQPTGGQVSFGGVDLALLGREELRRRRAEMQIVFQDPYASLNPRMRVGDIVEEGMAALLPDLPPIQRRERASSLLEQVGLGKEAGLRYPHEFSGGQRQRIAIARALAVNPRLIVCDEPTSALDVSVQAQILNLLKGLQDELGLAYLFITHNLAVVEYLAHEVAVMYLGRIVEQGPAEAVLKSPKHPYTQALLAAVPTLDPAKRREVLRLPGDLPSPLNPPAGCHFHPRCSKAMPQCQASYPEPAGDDGHVVSCHLYRQ